MPTDAKHRLRDRLRHEHTAGLGGGASGRCGGAFGQPRGEADLAAGPAGDVARGADPLPGAARRTDGAAA